MPAAGRRWLAECGSCTGWVFLGDYGDIHFQRSPFEGLGKEDLPAQLCAFTAAVLREEARHEPGFYDAVHSHYWLSGQVGWLARDRWSVPLIHTAHTLAKVKNEALAAGDRPEPRARVMCVKTCIR